MPTLTTPVLAQVYGRLVSAAMTQTYVTSGDVTPLIYGYKPARMSQAQARLVSDVLTQLFEFDCRHGRKPIVALFVKTNSQSPGPKFAELCVAHGLVDACAAEDTDAFQAYWSSLVEDIFASYRLEGD